MAHSENQQNCWELDLLQPFKVLHSSIGVLTKTLLYVRMCWGSPTVDNNDPTVEKTDLVENNQVLTVELIMLWKH